MLLTLLILEGILLSAFVAMEFTQYKYNTFQNTHKLILRIIINIPILLLICFAPDSTIKWIFLVSFILMFVGEASIIYNFLAGLAVNFIFNIFNVVALGVIGTQFNFVVFSILFAIFTLAYLFIFAKKLSGIFAIALPAYLTILIVEASFAYSLKITAFLGILGILLCDFEIGYTEFINKFPLFQQLNYVLWYGGLTLLYSTLYL